MTKNNTTRRVISIIISVVMLLTAFPLVAVADGETPAVQSEGIWYYLNTTWNSSKEDFGSESGKNVSIAIFDTDFYFMQTADNQEMTFTTRMYAKKKNNYDGIVFNQIAMNSSHTVPNSFFNGTWSQSTAMPSGNDGGDNSPMNDDMPREGIGGKLIWWDYTIAFTANGSATYSYDWTVTYRQSGNTITALSKTGGNPTFTITVIDMRELLDAIEIAEQRGKDTSAVLSGFDTTGSTYYTQEQVDAKLDEVMQLMCADYTALNAAIANAEALGENAKIPGGTRYEKSSYNAMASALAQAKAIDRYLEDTAENNAMLNAKAAELQAKVDAVVLTDTEVISYYVDGVLYATSEFVPNQGYNFHDVTDHYVEDPTDENGTFNYWVDEDGNKVAPNTPVNSSFSVYARFLYVTDGASGPVEQFGRWDHQNTDGVGENGVTMWVENNNFYFVRTREGQQFSFNAAVSAFRNGANKSARITDVVFENSNTAFISENNLSNDNIEYYNELPGDGSVPDLPSDSSNCNLPYVSGATFEEQMANSVYRWRYIYTFEAARNERTEAVYNFNWRISYKYDNSNTTNPGTKASELVPFVIKVTDLREIIRVYAKARSVANDANSPLSPTDQAALIALVESIDENYKFDGSAYYPQAEVNALADQLNSYIGSGTFPCDYTDLDAAIAQAADIIAIGNDNNRYMSEEWQDLLDAYSAATSVDRNLNIDDDNINQPMIDTLTENLEYAIEALSYKTHQHSAVDTSDLEELVDESTNNEPGTNNDNGKYDDDAWNEYIDALNDAQDVIDNYPDPTYDNDNGDGQKEVDDAEQRLQDALDALNDPANQNNPCDYTALDEAIAAAESITDNDLFTPETYQALQDALADGQDVDRDLYDNGTNQQIIDDATQAILDAIANLLTDAIDNAQGVDTTGMTPVSAQNLEDAIDNGRTVADDNTSTADEMASAINDIVSALDGLTPDKTELEEKIEEGNNTDTTGMTPESVQALEDAIAAGEEVYNDPDATVEEIQDAIQAIDDALNGLTPDKTELEEAIDAGESIDTTDIPQNLVDALEDALTNGETVDNDDDATVPEIKDATDDIIDAIKDILEYVKDDAEDTNTSDLTDDSLQDLEDAIENAENILNNPDANPEDIADAIEQLQDVIGNLEMNKIVPDAAGDINVDRFDTNYYYLVGLEADDTTLANVKSLLENDGRQIIAFRGETQLGENDHIGTGCIIKCVSIKDPSIVYEQATVILYGDVNGDGLVDSTDYDAMFNEALLGVAIEGELFRIAGDLNNDEVIDGFDLSKLELQLMGTREFDQTVEYYK